MDDRPWLMIGDADRDQDLVSISLFGRCILTSNGRKGAVAVDGRGFHFGVLAFILLQPEMEISRERLMDAVWGDRNAVQMRQNLRQCLTRLRRDLAPLSADILEIDNFSIRAKHDVISCDALEAMRLAEAGNAADMERISALLVGEFLEGFGRASEPFENWLRRERDRFHFLALSANLKAGEFALDQKRDARALVHAERAHALDPFDERAHRLLIAALARCQGRAAALHEAQRLERLVQDELGCPLEPETQRLVRELNATFGMDRRKQETGGNPVIAMGSFSFVGDDAHSGYIADGLTESIATQLSRLRWLRIVTCQPTGGAAGRETDPSPLAAAFRAHFVLTGSIRAQLPRIRVNVQLSEAASGTLVWSDQYDRDANDVFAVLDDITERVIAHIEPGLYAHEELRTLRRPSSTLDHWGKVAVAIGHVHSLDRERNAEAITLLDGVLAAEPKLARALAVRALARYWSQHFGWAQDRSAALLAAKADADAAVQADPYEAWGHAVLGFVQSYLRNHGDAVARLRTALDLNSSFSLGRLLLGWALVRAGDPAAAVRETAHAYGLKPRGAIGSVFAATHGLALLAARRFEEALPLMRESVAENAGHMGHNAALISCCGHLGRIDEALELRKIRFRVLGRQLTIEGAAAELSGFAHAPVFLEGLRLAGVPTPIESDSTYPPPWQPAP